MAIVDQKSKDEVKRIKGEIDNLNKENSAMKSTLSKNKDIAGYLRIGIAINHLKIIGYNIACADLSTANASLFQRYLNDGRKEITKVLVTLEEIVDNDIQMTLGENTEKAIMIDNLTVQQKMNLLKSLKSLTLIIIEKFGPKSKWATSFQDIHSRTAVIAKNITNWRKIETNRDPRDPEYYPRITWVKWIKEAFYFAAKEYKSRYELSTTKVPEDIKMIVRLFEALLKILNHFSSRAEYVEPEEIERVKNLIESNKLILESGGKKKKKATGKKKKK